MEKVTIRSIVQTALISALTIAAALIWKDVIIEFIDSFFPPAKSLFYKFIAALIATVFVVVAIYLLLKTETEAEHLVKNFKKRRKI